MRRHSPLLAAALGLAAWPVLAAPNTFQLDSTQSRVEFTLADVLHTVHGTFQVKSGAITFDPQTGEAAGTVVVDAGSGDSGSHARDSRMEAKFLEAQKYPQITFTATHVDGHIAASGDSQVQVHGVFGLHGQQHEIVVPATLHIAGDQLTAALHFDLPYQQWGVKNPSTFILRVSDKVQIELHAAGRLVARATS